MLRGEPDADGHIADRVFENEVPAYDPGDELAHGGIRVCVRAARDGDHGGQFGVGQTESEAAGDRHLKTKDSAMDGPAPGRPKEAEWYIKYSNRGALRMDFTWSFWPAIAVPTMVKIPEPITAPIPRDVRLSQPSDFFNRTSAFSESDNSWSMPLQRKRGVATRTLRSHPRELKPACRIRCARWDCGATSTYCEAGGGSN